MIIKKLLVSLTLATSLAAPVFAFADHTPSHTIEQLRAQIAALQTQLNAVLQQGGKPVLSETRRTEVSSSRVSSPSLFTERALQDRKTRLLRLAKTDPKLFLDEALSRAQRGSVSKELRPLVESDIDLTAKIEVLHTDDFQNKKTNYQYFLRTGIKRLQLYSEGDLSFLPSGSLVQVRGFQLDDIVVTRADSETFRLLEATRVPAGVGDQKIAVVLLQFQNTPPARTRQEMHDIIFNGQLQKYFREQSYGHMSLSGDVFGWFAAPRGVSCDSFIFSPTGPSLPQLIADLQIDLSRYQHLVVVPDYCDGAGGWSAGMTQLWTLINGNLVSVGSVRLAMVLGSEYSFSSWWSGKHLPPFALTVFDFVFAHEFGHNLGVYHANSWDCANGIDPLYSNCRHAEYGNYFDAMGYGLHASHFNAKYKEIIGWLNNANVLAIKSSGRYTIGPLEGGQSGYRAAKIAVPESPPFYLEYRRPIGFDSALGDATLLSNASGLMINWIINPQEDPKMSSQYPSSFSPYITRLLDADSSFGDAKSQVSLRGPSVFRDPGRGITIGPVVRADASGITFDVAIDSASSVCMRKMTATGNGAWFDAANNTIGLSLNITNQDTPSCGSSKFSATIVAPSGWTVEKNSSDPFWVNPDQSQWVGYVINVPSGVPEGSYLITGFVTNTTANVAVPFNDIRVDVGSKSAPPAPPISAPTAVAPAVSSAPIQISSNGQISQKLHYAQSSDSFYGIGSDNAIWKWDNSAKQWSRITDGSVKDDFHFISESDIYAIGMDNQIWHWNGIRWNQESQGGKIQHKIWYIDGNHIYGIGMDNQVWRYGSASGWIKITSNGQIKDDFHFISESDIYAIGLDGQIWRWNGSAWNQISSGGVIRQKLHFVNPTTLYGIGTDNRIWGWSNSSWGPLHDSGQVKDDLVFKDGGAYAIGLDNQIWRLPRIAFGSAQPRNGALLANTLSAIEDILQRIGFFLRSFGR